MDWTAYYHGLIFTGLPALRVLRVVPLVEFALAVWARQFELFTFGLTSQHGAARRCDSCGKLNVDFVVPLGISFFHENNVIIYEMICI